MKEKIKVGGLVEMTYNWKEVGKPKGSIHEVLGIDERGAIRLAPTKDHHGLFALSYVKLYKSKAIFEYPKRLQHLVPKI